MNRQPLLLYEMAILRKKQNINRLALFSAMNGLFYYLFAFMASTVFNPHLDAKPYTSR